MRYLIVFLTILVVFYTHLYIYSKGLEDGEQNYKHSNRIYFALKSAYHYGYQDCKSGGPENWDGD